MTTLLESPAAVQADWPAWTDQHTWELGPEADEPSDDDRRWWSEQTRDDADWAFHPTIDDDPTMAEFEAAYRASEAAREEAADAMTEAELDRWADEMAGESEALDRLTAGCLL